MTFPIAELTCGSHFPHSHGSQPASLHDPFYIEARVSGLGWTSNANWNMGEIFPS